MYMALFIGIVSVLLFVLYIGRVIEHAMGKHFGAPEKNVGRPKIDVLACVLLAGLIIGPGGARAQGIPDSGFRIPDSG
jgi:hypothetical protein